MGRFIKVAGLTDVGVDCVGESCCATSEQGKDASVSIFVAFGATPSGCVSD